MAPNLQRLSSISESLADLKIVRAKDIVVEAPRPAYDSDSYWDWSEPATFTSTIEANLLRDAPSLMQAESQTDASHDYYWCETTAPQHAVVETKPVYWEESHTPECDDYYNWDSAKPYAVHPSTEKSRETERYWDEQVYDRHESDAYWNQPTDNMDYWGWSTATQSRSDDYWAV